MKLLTVASASSADFGIHKIIPPAMGLEINDSLLKLKKSLFDSELSLCKAQKLLLSFIFHQVSITPSDLPLLSLNCVILRYTIRSVILIAVCPFVSVLLSKLSVCFPRMPMIYKCLFCNSPSLVE